MGRHSSTTRRGIRPPVLVVSVLLVLGLIGTLLFVLLRDRLQAASCDTLTELTVTAAPDIEPTITAAAREASAAEANGSGCYQVTVASRDSATTAEALAVSDGTERPDVWLPESTMWLQRAQDKGAWSGPVGGTSIASSPVIFALTEDAATGLGWPTRAPTWGDVIGPTAKPMTVGFPDPARDPIGVSTLYGLRELTRTDQSGASTATLRRLSANTTAEPSELFGRLPGGATEAEPLDAFPTSENALLRHNVKQNIGKLVAAYADPAVPPLDYPYAVLPDIAADKRAAAGKFLDRLMSQQTSEALADAGFRTPDGVALRDRSEDKRVSAVPMTPIKPLVPNDVELLLNDWATVNLSGRVQVLLDVSGTMSEPVPGTDKTRMDITVQAAVTGVGLFKPTTKIGFWLFSTRLDGDRDYTELLPMRTVAEHASSGSLDRLRAVKAVDGGTGLYDSVLAAYQNARQNWEPGRINVIVVLTDGRENDDRISITLEQLVTELRELQDPRRPLKIIGIGIGPGVDATELKTITEPTGGEAFIAEDPTKIGNVFFAALGRMLTPAS